MISNPRRRGPNGLTAPFADKSGTLERENPKVEEQDPQLGEPEHLLHAPPNAASIKSSAACMT